MTGRPAEKWLSRLGLAAPVWARNLQSAAPDLGPPASVQFHQELSRGRE